MTIQAITDRARTLFDQHRASENFSPFLDAEAIGNVNEAYAVQEALVALESSHLDTSIVGYKIGLTSPRMQALLGIDSPIAGAVLDGRIHESGVSIRRGNYVNLGIECEIAVRMGRDLPQGEPPFDFAHVAAEVLRLSSLLVVPLRRNEYRPAWPGC